MIQIELNNKLVEVSKHQLFTLAARGQIGRQTKLIFNGKESTVGKVQGITFGENSVKESVAFQTNSPIQAHTVEQSNRFQFTAEEQAEIDKFCAEHGTDVNAVDEKGWTLLRKAASLGSFAVVKYFVSQGANVNAVNMEKDKSNALLEMGVVLDETPLDTAARYNKNNKNIEIIKFLVAEGANVSIGNPLFHATSLSVFKYFVSLGANVSAKDQANGTLLHSSLLVGDAAFTEFLISKGISVHAKDNFGNTPLHRAAQRMGDKIEAVRFLVSQDADVNARSNSILYPTPLHAAVMGNNVEVVKFLVYHGADINAKNISEFVGLTPLEVAKQHGKATAIIECLSNVSAIPHPATQAPNQFLFTAEEQAEIDKVRGMIGSGDINMVLGDQGITFLHGAVLKGSIALAKFLISQNADINAKDKQGNTPLHLAIQKENVEMVKLLISKKAGVNIRTNNGEFPIHAAVMKGSIEIVDILVANGSDVNARENMGPSPLQAAVFSGNIEIVKILVSHGADIHVKTRNGASLLACAKSSGNPTMIRYISSQSATF